MVKCEWTLIQLFFTLKFTLKKYVCKEPVQTNAYKLLSFTRFWTQYSMLSLGKLDSNKVWPNGPLFKQKGNLGQFVILVVWHFNRNNKDSEVEEIFILKIGIQVDHCQRRTNFDSFTYHVKSSIASNVGPVHFLYWTHFSVLKVKTFEHLTMKTYQ